MNATKYEVALFVDESTNMVAEGTYLFTIGIIPVTLDISTVITFIGAVSGTGTVQTNFAVDEGASVDQLVVTALDPLHVGVYTFNISLAILDFIFFDPVVSHVTEAEVRVLPPPRKCVYALHCIVYILTCIYVHNIVQHSIQYNNENAFEGMPLTAQRCIVIVADMRYIQYVCHFQPETFVTLSQAPIAGVNVHS